MDRTTRGIDRGQSAWRTQRCPGCAFVVGLGDSAHHQTDCSHKGPPSTSDRKCCRVGDELADGGEDRAPHTFWGRNQ